MSKDWYCQIDGQEVGPMEAAKLKSLATAGTLKKTDRVRKSDWDDWRPAKQLKKLWASIESRKTVGPEPEFSGVEASEERYHQWTKKMNLLTIFSFILTLSCLMFGLFVLLDDSQTGLLHFLSRKIPYLGWSMIASSVIWGLAGLLTSMKLISGPYLILIFAFLNIVGNLMMCNIFGLILLLPLLMVANEVTNESHFFP